MKKDTLAILQTIARISRVLSKIAMITCIVGSVCCVVGVGALAFGLMQDITVPGIIEAESGRSVSSLYAAVISAAIITAVEAVVAWFAVRYFTHELEAGTPFTFEGAREMFRLGVITAVSGLGVNAVASLVATLFEGTDVSMQNDTFSLGLVFMLISLLLKHGAEIAAGKPQSEE